MKKKITKKLKLSKETLRNLSGSHLGLVVGGTISELRCLISNQLTCGCVSGACTEFCPSQAMVCRHPPTG
jgi:hypothetical protein